MNRPLLLLTAALLAFGAGIAAVVIALLELQHVLG